MAAELLGIGERTLYRKLRKYDVETGGEGGI
jgi:transcriptional regulator of acetoin/glycerol metabolism